MIDEQNQFPVTDSENSINSNSLPRENVTQLFKKYEKLWFKNGVQKNALVI